MFEGRGDCKAVRAIKTLDISWPVPANVHTLISTRQGGFSQLPYAQGNLGDHVGDDIRAVLNNRQMLMEQTGENSWHWLDQVHGVDLLQVKEHSSYQKVVADGSFTQLKRQVCAVLTADCLPVLLCDSKGSQVAAIHAGWRGLSSGILKAAVQSFSCSPSGIMAYLGPAISAKCFEVGQDVFNQFILDFGQGAELYFQKMEDKPGHYLADLYGLAKFDLLNCGVSEVFGGDYCTYGDESRFYSYRREAVTGRIVSAIWLT